MPVPGTYAFRLYVAGQSAHSVSALQNLQALCQDLPPDHVDIEIVNVLTNPARALADRILVTPTLIRLHPTPAIRILGSLQNLPAVAITLGLEPASP